LDLKHYWTNRMLLPLAITVAHVGMIALLVFGFGFVSSGTNSAISSAAKWVGIRVEQFAVGFGQVCFLAQRHRRSRRKYAKRLSRTCRKISSGKTRSSPALEQAEYSDEQIANRR